MSNIEPTNYMKVLNASSQTLNSIEFKKIFRYEK